jgi:hypothetical protein
MDLGDAAGEALTARISTEVASPEERLIERASLGPNDRPPRQKQIHVVVGNACAANSIVADGGVDPSSCWH